MITASQILAHLWGDYIFQSDWMANNKTKAHLPALAHVLTYSIAFIFLRPSPLAFAVIIGTHFFIDRYRLARYVVLAKNTLAPRDAAAKLLKTFNVNTGYPESTPDWLAVWLLIIADNILHLTINGLALKYL